MTATVAIVLPDASNPACTQAAAMVRALSPFPGGFRRVVIGPAAAQAGIEGEFRPAPPLWFHGSPGRRYAAGVARVLRGLRPDVIEVHDCPQMTLALAGPFRPVPVILILHTDPQARRGAHDAPSRTYLLAQATRVATVSPALRERMLEGVHPAMRHCAVLPAWDGPAQATLAANAVDALRLDALQAWSRRLHATI